MLKTAVKRSAIVALAGSLLLSAHAIADDTKRAIRIPSGDLAAALELLAKQSGSDLVYRPDHVQGLKTVGVTGELSTQEAVTKLLQGTPLTVSVDSTGAILISLPAASSTNDAARSSASAIAARSSTSRDEVEEVVVTGTNIRGAVPTSQVVTITPVEMRLSGHTNLGEVVRALPQNFSGGQNPGVGLSLPNPNGNITGSSSLNLRGLGPDATLTLLNGARLPYDGIVQATDVSVVPIAAIERMEILLDGASALYGSDAVGGVANIVLKRDFEGAEVSARYGVATEGGFEQQQYSAVAGTTWSSGGFLAAVEHSENSPVYARQREYLRRLPNQGVTVFPEATQLGTLFSGHQQFGDYVELTLDAFYTDREGRDFTMTAASWDHTREAEIWGVAPTLRFDLPSDWSIRLHGTMGSNENTNKLRAFDAVTGAPLAAIHPSVQYINDAETIGAAAEGPLFALAGGPARLSFGAGYRSADFAQYAVLARETLIGGGTHSRHGYGEINLPFAARFTVNGAVRYEDHDTFGDVTTPKIGFVWGPTSTFDIKASWGKSFKAPTLAQLYNAPALYLYPGFFLGLPPTSTAMLAAGGDVNLDPERAEVMTASFVARPEFLPGFSLEVSWFDIEYTDRVAMPFPDVTQALNPAFAEFVTVNPTVAQQNAAFAAAGLPAGTFTTNISGGPYNPANVGAIVRSGYANVTADHSSGFDVTARQRLRVFDGQLAFTASASWLDATRHLTSVYEIDSGGVMYFPAKFKGRFGASWSRAGLTLTGNVNHVAGVKNTAETPIKKGASMTTLDLIADYRIEAGALDGLGVNLAIINALDREPPYLRARQSFQLPFDSTNYSAVGRTVSATVTKRF